MTYYSLSQEKHVYQCYPCLTKPPKQISLVDIRHSIAENQEQPGHDDYILANPNHMDREGTLDKPHPAPCFQELENGVNRVLKNINVLNDNMEHVFVTLQAMDRELVHHVTNKACRVTIEHELMDIKQALSRIYSTYSNLIEVKAPKLEQEEADKNKPVDIVRNGIKEFKKLLRSNFPGCEIFVCSRKGYMELEHKYSHFQDGERDITFNVCETWDFDYFINTLKYSIMQNNYPDKVVKFAVTEPFFVHYPAYSVHIICDKQQVTNPYSSDNNDHSTATNN